jgi:tripartite-type tricarboxylate transporter receptor subunit TctC
MPNPRFPNGRPAGEASAMSVPTRRAAAGTIASWAGLAALAPTRGAAQAAWPVRPVRIVVPFAPGGGADLIARMLTPHLQQRLEQSFFVDNRAGAAGRIGAGRWRKPTPTATPC